MCDRNLLHQYKKKEAASYAHGCVWQERRKRCLINFIKYTMHKENISFYMCSHFWFIEYASVFNYIVMNATFFQNCYCIAHEIEHPTYMKNWVSLKEYKKSVLSSFHSNIFIAARFFNINFSHFFFSFANERRKKAAIKFIHFHNIRFFWYCCCCWCYYSFSSMHAMP